ncbi:small acidic protein family-domain-containing protein [Chaetomium strumarium]|uniref:Small acidic protein n=1 Tax=Chaetomium strumarium TaxID=1170767 RepID=A0AAJ0M4K8_9PEZI|nr:small acidic protein family-domain-containing protein [Chaetomium strumarium]
MGEKSKKKALEPKNDAAALEGAADTSMKEKIKKSNADQSTLPESETVEVPRPKEEHKDDDKKSKKEKKKHGKRKREATDLPAETETTSEVKGVTEAEQAEPPKKKKKAGSPDADDKAEKKKRKKDKDKKKTKDQASGKETQVSGGKDEQDIAKTDQTDNRGKYDDKVKKETESKEVDMAEATDAPPSEVKEERPWQKARREKRERKKAEKAEKKLKRKGKNGNAEREVDEEERRMREEKKRRKEAKYGPRGKGKKGKKSKASGGSEDVPKQDAPAPASTSAPSAAPDANLSERWNVQQLDGGAKRQDKFMRLLGGKKQGTTNATAGTGQAKDGARKRLDIGQVSQELEKQFNAGVQMKFGTGGQRRGLGA